MKSCKSCRVCSGTTLSLAIDLKEQPLANHFHPKEKIGEETLYPLCVVYCHQCATAQLDYTVKKEIVYGDRRNSYLSGITKTLDTHFAKLAETVDSRFFKEKRVKAVLDIGSNDGTQLKHFQKLGYEVLGVDPGQDAAHIANQAGIPTHHAFFNADFAKELGTQFDVINAAGVFFHLEELHSVTEGIKLLLKEEGVFVVQFLYMKCILENRAFDQIYHEHLLYYTLKTVEALLQQHGLALFDATLSPIHGGSIIGFVSHKGKYPPSVQLEELKREEEHSGCNRLEAYLKFAQEIEALKKENLDFLSKRKEEGKKLFGMGAPVKGNTLLNYFGIGPHLLSCLVEKNPLREGLYSPGMHLPIVMEATLDSPPDVYYVLAWNFKKEILKNNQHLIDKGVEFYFPITSKTT